MDDLHLNRPVLLREFAATFSQLQNQIASCALAVEAMEEILIRSGQIEKNQLSIEIERLLVKNGIQMQRRKDAFLEV